jgi:hypothetical protein
MVASIIAYSLSGSSAKVLKRLSQTPLAAQREKRLWVFFQSPKRSGKSRHGAPERNFQITASTNRRLPSSLLRRDDVFDLTARHADIRELPVVQAVQLGAFPLSFAPFFAPFLKTHPNIS